MYLLPVQCTYYLYSVLITCTVYLLPVQCTVLITCTVYLLPVQCTYYLYSVLYLLPVQCTYYLYYTVFIPVLKSSVLFSGTSGLTCFRWWHSIACRRGTREGGGACACTSSESSITPIISLLSALQNINIQIH